MREKNIGFNNIIIKYNCLFFWLEETRVESKRKAPVLRDQRLSVEIVNYFELIYLSYKIVLYIIHQIVFQGQHSYRELFQLPFQFQKRLLLNFSKL